MMCYNTYKILNDERFKYGSYHTKDLGEGMAVVEENWRGWFMPHYLLNHNTKYAYEIADSREWYLRAITKDDVDWESLKSLPKDAIISAKGLSFIYPSNIQDFLNGVALFNWQLLPYNGYNSDNDGRQITDGENIVIHGFIDHNSKIVIKFRYIKNNTELDQMRELAEAIVKRRDAR